MRKKSSVAKVADASPLSAALQTHFGFENFKGQQEAIIQSILSGKDTFVIMPTGGGKSLCYQLPALMSEGVALVVSPLIALMKNQVDLVRGYSSRDNVAHFLNSTLTKAQQKKVKDDLLSGTTKLLYVAPETLTKADNIAFFKEIKISFVAVDEAHCISEWGHDFRPEYRKLRGMIEEIDPTLPIIALTATATPKVQDDIVKNLALREPTVFIDSFNRPNLSYEIVPKGTKDQTLRSIVKFIHSMRGKSGIIYTLNRKTTEELAQTLSANGVKAVAYHAGLDAALRAQRQDQFLHEEVEVIVATIAFGMGIDKPDVRFVAHIDLPKSVEGYTQETGRAGRDGEPAEAWMTYGLGDVVQLGQMIAQGDSDESRKRVEQRKLDALVGYCESMECRRQVLLANFGETYPQPCGNCDNCLAPPESWDASLAAQKALSCVYRSGQRFGAGQLIDILRGADTDRIRQFGHDALSTYGIGTELDARSWRGVFRQLVAGGWLAVDVEGHGSLRLTAKSTEILKDKRTVMLRKEAPRKRDRASTARNAQVVDLDPVALPRFEALRALRTQLAREQGVPPYVIFHDRTLREIARLNPGTLDVLAEVGGIGSSKLERYGDAVLEALAGA